MPGCDKKRREIMISADGKSQKILKFHKIETSARVMKLFHNQAGLPTLCPTVLDP